jgi:hypothetical protein
MRRWQTQLKAALLGLLSLAVGVLVLVPPPAAATDTAAYIAFAAPLAQREQKRYAVPASVAIAQSILESGWGRSGLTTEANNYFGIKCPSSGNPANTGSPYVTGCVAKDSYEYLPEKTLLRSWFRTYASAESSFLDHGLLLSSRSWYAKAFAYTDNPDQFIREVAAGGYATDATYADMVIRIMKQYNLYQYDRPAATSVAPSSTAPTRASSTAVAPTSTVPSVAPSSVAPTSPAPSVAPSSSGTATVAPTSLRPTTAPPTAVAPSTPTTPRTSSSTPVAPSASLPPAAVSSTAKPSKPATTAAPAPSAVPTLPPVAAPTAPMTTLTIPASTPSPKATATISATSSARQVTPVASPGPARSTATPSVLDVPQPVLIALPVVAPVVGPSAIAQARFLSLVLHAGPTRPAPVKGTRIAWAY